MKSGLAPSRWGTNGSAMHAVVMRVIDQGPLFDCYLRVCSGDAELRLQGYQAIELLHATGHRKAGLLLAYCDLRGLVLARRAPHAVKLMADVAAASQDEDGAARAAALMMLAECYRRAEGVRFDPDAALRLYVAAAHLGIGVAALLAGYYFQGAWPQGPTGQEDFAKAAAYFQLGIAHGCPYCRLALTSVALHATPAPRFGRMRVPEPRELALAA